jgi:hypothetical protein
MKFCINHQCQQPENLDNDIFCSSCGSELLVNGKYRVVSRRSQSINICTYDVQEIIDGNNEVNKIIQVSSIINSLEIELFKRIITALQNIDHSGIAKITEDGYFTYFPKDVISPLHCFITNKISGITLDEYMHRQDYHPLDENLVCQWLKEVVNILELLHNQNILHLAINPQNILLQDDGNLALIDILNINQINTFNSVEYSPYIPPEQFNNSPIIQSDFFALGVTFVYLLTGKEANKDPDVYQSDDPQVKWQSFIPQTNKLTELPKLIDSMMESAPVKRPENSQAILKILDHLTEPLLEVSPNQNKSLFMFVMNWALATLAGASIGGTIGFCAGFCASFLIGAVAKNVSVGILWGGIIFGLMTGLITGLMQSWVLVQFGYRVKYWIFLTTLGFTVESALGVLISNYDYGSKIFLIPGIFLGISQFLILRKYIKHSLLWIIINVLSGVIGIVIILEMQNIFASKYQIFGYFAALIVFGILTGVSLIKLTRNGSTLAAQK